MAETGKLTIQVNDADSVTALLYPAVKQNRAEAAVPDLDGKLHSGLGGVQRNKPQRVIEQMRADVDEQNEAGCHAEIPAQQIGGSVREQRRTPPDVGHFTLFGEHRKAGT